MEVFTVNERKKMCIYLFGLFTEIIIITGYIFFKNNLNNFQDIILLNVVQIIIFISIFFGTYLGLMSSLIIVFAYGSFLFYNIVILQNENFANPYNYIWILILFISGLTIPYIGGFFKTLSDNFSQLNENFSKFMVFDPLTGFKNERAFYDDLLINMENYRRYNFGFSIMIINIRYIEDFQNMYGTEKTKLLLNYVSQKIESALRLSDLKYTISLGKFTLILPNTSKENSLIIRDRIKTSDDLSSLNLHIGSSTKSFKLEYQLGIVEFTGQTENPLALKEILEMEAHYDS